MTRDLRSRQAQVLGGGGGEKVRQGIEAQLSGGREKGGKGFGAKNK